MAEIIDSRPKLVLVMGCNGCGKSAWKRNNYDSLPEIYFDQDSVAGGIGDWDKENARERAREIVYEKITECFEARLDFGFESTFSGRPGVELLERAVANKYQVEGCYIGTRSPDINIERIHRRVVLRRGHYIDPARIPNRWNWSLSNLRKYIGLFDFLEALDNSVEHRDELLKPSVQFRAEKGKIVFLNEELEEWSKEFLRRLDLAKERDDLM
ncbi:MAG: hypothetical protein OXG24_11700 [Gammaproteobacteria bacterium]|nr:hypothetical protein [Gammaproteobacteria bacterium]